MDAQPVGPPDNGKGLIAEWMAFASDRDRLGKILDVGSVRGGLSTTLTGDTFAAF